MISNPTYLEISGRQTGKTTRLLKAIHEHLKVGDVVLYARPLMMPPLYDLGWRDAPFRVYQVGHGGAEDHRGRLTNPRTFVDDWDFLKYFPIERGGYYCTTLQYLRDYEDTLGGTPFGQLWNLKDVFVSHLSPVNPDFISARALPESGQVFRTEVTELDTKAGEQGYDPAGEQDYDGMACDQRYDAAPLAGFGEFLCDNQRILNVSIPSGRDSDAAAIVASRLLFRYMYQNRLVLVAATNPRKRNGDGVCPECGRP